MKKSFVRILIQPIIFTHDPKAELKNDESVTKLRFYRVEA